MDLRLTLEFDLILNDEGFALIIYLLGEFGGDGMVSCRVLDNKTLVTLYGLEDRWLFNRPLAHVGPLLGGL